MLHDRLVDLDHLVDDFLVPVRDGPEVAFALALPKQSTTRLPPSAGRFSGRHSGPKASRSSPSTRAGSAPSGRSG
jgi:hypothetical protein